jgi:heat shock protein HslJ
MKRTAMSLTLLLALGACAPTQTSTPVSITAASPLVGTNWVLTKLGDVPAAVGAGQREPFLQLQAADSRISGFAGCNMFAGPYQLSGESLSFGPLAMTRMACPPPGMTLEGSYANALRDTKSYKITGTQLALMDASGKALAGFVAK